MAGPYVKFESTEPYHIPQRIFCRKSIAKYVEKIVKTWFTVAKRGLEFYEDMFGTPYPFGKIDHVFVADYNMGAMENVGCILYTDGYVERDEVITNTRRQNILITLLHELSHLWFGDLVTMKWWDDLWLNESFANFISYLALDKAKGLEEYNLSWSMYLDEHYWGLKEDKQDTTHPIATHCEHTEQASDLFDGISYGKGACFLKQLYFYFGEEVLRVGIKSYFAKYAYKNTELKDFIQEMDIAAKKVGITEDLVEWSKSWLETSGVNILKCEYVEEGDTIKTFELHQSLHKNGKNQLRK